MSGWQACPACYKNATTTRGEDRDGQPEAKTEQVEYPLAAQRVEDVGARGVDVSAVSSGAPAALRMRQLRLLQRPLGRRPTGRDRRGEGVAAASCTAFG